MRLDFSKFKDAAFALGEWWYAQPIVLSRAAQEDWAAQPLPTTERKVRKEIRRLALVANPCEHITLRRNELQDRLPYLRLKQQLPPMPLRRQEVR